MLPHGLLPRVETANQNIVVPAINRPLFDDLVRVLVVEVGLLPLAKEYLLSEPVR